MSGITESLSNLVFGRPDQPDIPVAEIPAAPAPTRKQDTGALVAIGSDAAKDKRASGGGGGSTSSRTTVDVLGSLGKTGVSI